ncbi:CRISPR-associated helicase Cas3 [Sphingobium sp. SYK-6]|uniref:CRISPR-associated endonuclease Cas3'' n=1 Tax=Sphingobium sp. (strain NBRC 103272 / SYK-6) TaxID=627192 RepID=UPI00022771A7|nr:CRISPR-associated endonuclease Cas3'' [Sphingobium sp. SYK-6]BAK66413.1 CRISPR-associated helicase Cas3 [Sphingobium sp. SYK-6]
MIYAHSISSKSENTWEPLSHHLSSVSNCAEAFAERFGVGVLGRIMGALHDIGKCSAAYQHYIRTPQQGDGRARGPDHSTAGAKEALRLYGVAGRLMAFGIAGHHSGLMDGPSLTERENKAVEDYVGWEGQAPPLPDRRTWMASMTSPQPNAIEPAFRGFFLTRMLFSCLVDADFLETERFYAVAEGRSPPERGGRIDRRHRDAVRTYMAKYRREDTPVNTLRSQILDHAVVKAALTPGLFTLTVPTGGGKTLTSLSFAIEHALRHGLERIIYVIPFTSIIEQTAEVFRTALGAGLAGDVLEHHSSFDWDARQPTEEGDEEGEGASGLAKLRRDAENWDVPIVVTTAVQFFESLFAARTSRARKLHNLAKSVIVIDEAQSIPVHLLRPCMAAIDELAKNYGASVVLCTATQPALRKQDDALPRPVRAPSDAGPERTDGLDIPDERELAPDPRGLYRRLRRVRVEWSQMPVPDAAIAARFAERPQMLCIVNSRAHARELFEAIRHQPGARHLTTLMCARHRRDVLASVRADLAAGQPVRLVATSLIEAGVDVSFPEVWRAAAGLSNIAQAAGRCNRSGELGPLGEAHGRTLVFEPEMVEGRRPIPRDLMPFYDAAREVLKNPALDPLSLEGVTDYYRWLYWKKGYAALDQAKGTGSDYPILSAIHETVGRGGVNCPFRTISDAFQMIDQAMDPVLIPYDADAEEALRVLVHADRPPAGTLRTLQQYVVPVPKQIRAAMLANGDAAVVREDYGDRFVRLGDMFLYDRSLGLALSTPEWRASEQNIM